MIATPPGNWRCGGASAPDPTTNQFPTVHYGDLPQDPQDAAKESRMEADEPPAKTYTIRDLLLHMIDALEKENPDRFFQILEQLHSSIQECMDEVRAEIEQEDA